MKVSCCAKTADSKSIELDLFADSGASSVLEILPQLYHLVNQVSKWVGQAYF